MLKGLKIILLGVGVIVVGFSSFFITSYFINGNDDKGATITNQVIQNNDNTPSRPNVRGTENVLTKENSEGTVEIKTTLLTEKSSNNQLVFEVVMNTHSGDLLQYDFAKLANIGFGKETNKSGIFEWQPSNQDSHHLKGVLTWKGQIDKNPSFIDLDLKTIDQIPSRIFHWEKSKAIDEMLKK